MNTEPESSFAGPMTPTEVRDKLSERPRFGLQRRAASHRKRYCGILCTTIHDVRWRGPWRRYKHQAIQDMRNKAADR